MSRTIITNMTHFLNGNDYIPESLSNKSRKLAKHISLIVLSVTGSSDDATETPIPCWSRVNKKRCGGKIGASIDLGNFNIFWHCLRCGDNGAITHWIDTLWDSGYR